MYTEGSYGSSQELFKEYYMDGTRDHDGKWVSYELKDKYYKISFMWNLKCWAHRSRKENSGYQRLGRMWEREQRISGLWIQSQS
jgi:hypothetical protein